MSPSPGTSCSDVIATASIRTSDSSSICELWIRTPCVEFSCHIHHCIGGLDTGIQSIRPIQYSADISDNCAFTAFTRSLSQLSCLCRVIRIKMRIEKRHSQCHWQCCTGLYSMKQSSEEINSTTVQEIRSFHRLSGSDPVKNQCV